MTAGEPVERVVLLDQHGATCGVADKATVHHHDTPLHLAFSCYIFDDHGHLLVTRRALGKRTWPGVWTNSCCGHPQPGEAVADAVIRRVGTELGMTVSQVACVLPEFRYRAEAADGTVENEICPVFTARAASPPDPHPDEVLEWRWVPWARFAEVATGAPWAMSPWAAEQAPLLAAARYVSAPDDPPR